MKAAARVSALLSMALLVGCGGPAPLSSMAPRSDFAAAIHRLYLEIIGWDSLILAVVAGALLLALFWFSTRAAEVEPPRRAGEHLGLEVVWTLGPALIVMLIAIPSLRVSFRSQAPAPAGAMVVQVIGHQWWWEVRYPELKIVTANEIHLAQGKPVVFKLESADVIHSFWVPRLGGKRDLIPGHVNQITLVPRSAGYYYGECAEFCGLSHANMRFRVIVSPPEDFERWTRQQRAAPSIAQGGAVAGDLRAPGAKLYAGSPCTACHAITGVSAGALGPDLTHFGSRTTLAGGILPNTPENLAAWLKNPQAIKPGANMPALGMNDAQIQQLTAYLGTLK